MKRTILIFLMFIYFQNLFSQTSSQTSPINLTVFKSVPDSLYGCSCTFSLNKTQYDTDKYVFFADGNNAIISINNKEIYLRNIKGSVKEINGFGEKDKYSNDTYKVYLKNIKKAGTGYESTIYSAELIIEHTDGHRISRKVYGICGC